MDRRTTRIFLIFGLCAIVVGLAPVIPLGEVSAPEHGRPVEAAVAAGSSGNPLSLSSESQVGAVSSVADASTIEKLRLLFSR